RVSERIFTHHQNSFYTLNKSGWFIHTRIFIFTNMGKSAAPQPFPLNSLKADIFALSECLLFHHEPVEKTGCQSTRTVVRIELRCHFTDVETDQVGHF